MIHRIVTSVTCAIFLCMSVLALGASPAHGQDVDRESSPLVYESESSQAQDKKGFFVFLREAPSKEQIQALNDQGADLSLGSWIPPSGSEETGFLYVRVPSSNISSVADLPFVTNYRDASMVEMDDEQTLQGKAANKRARLNPYKYGQTEDDVLKLHAIWQVRSPEAAKEWAAARGRSTEEGKVKVAIEPLGDGPAPTNLIQSLGGTVDLTYQDTRFAWIPTENLKKLAVSLGENYRVRMPRVPQQEVISSEGVERIEAEKYHQKGLKGDDVTVGVIDQQFDRIPDSDLPSDVVKLDCTGAVRSGCGEEDDLNSTFDNFLISGTHGTAAAEMVADMAPESTLRLYLVRDEADVAEAVSNGLDNGVDVFSHSLGFTTTPWHDDEGIVVGAANDASEGGSLFFNSAGNAAERHWQGSFRDDDGDDLHKWNNSGEEDEVNDFTLADDEDVEITVRWNTDDGNDTDNYDLFITDKNGQVLDQSQSGGETFERLTFENNSGSARDLGIGIEQVSGNGNFEVFVRGPIGFLGGTGDIEYFVSRSSVTSPSNATEDNVISVAAVDENNFTDPNPDPKEYSSQGPTNDGNQAPIVTGPTNTSTSGNDIEGGTFGGTSAAAPHAAGAAAILWDSKAESGSPSASEVRQDFLDAALNERDWGDPSSGNGIDYVYGYGGVFLPDVLDDLQITFNQVLVSLFPLVTSVVTVTDSDGDIVTGLEESSFSVQEEGVSETITNVNEIRQSGGNVSSSLVIDRSGSMGGQKISDAKNAAKTFVDQLMSGDQASVISFSSGVTLDQPFTSDAAALKSAIDNLSAGGGTALYDGIVRGVQEIELEANSPAVLVLTDGIENSSSNSKQDAIDIANQAGVPVYTIGLGGGVNASDLQDIADQTGGRFFQAPNSSDLETIYQEISQQLSSRYAVTYETSNPQLDGTVRTIELTSMAGGASGTKSTIYTAPSFRIPFISSFASDPQPGETAQASVEVGSESQPADDLFRATFTVNYDAENLDVVNDEPGSFFGQNVQYRSSINDSEGTIDIGIRSSSGGSNSLQNALAKRTLNGKSQKQGTLVSFEFSVASDAPSDKDYDLSLSNINTIDSDGNPIAVATPNEDGRIGQQGNPQAECDAVAAELGTGPLEPFAKYENPNDPNGGFVGDLPGDGNDITFDPDPPTVPSGSWSSTTPIKAFLIKQGRFIDYWADPGSSLDYTSPEDDYLHFTFCTGGSFECDKPTLGQDDINRTDRTLSNTIQDDEGVSEFTFSTLENFTVASISPSSGFDRSGNTWTWTGSGDPPTEVDFTLEAGDGNTSTYFLEVTDACTDPNTVTFDPSYELGPSASQPRLAGNAPNPFSGETTIEFVLPERTRVTVSVYDMMGRKVATLVDEVRSAGTHAVGWDGQSANGQDLASGVYLMRMQAGGQSSTKRLTIVR